ncbi:multidrug resistance efflux transporter family protein [Planococcus maitriensis]
MTEFHRIWNFYTALSFAAAYSTGQLITGTWLFIIIAANLLSLLSR